MTVTCKVGICPFFFNGFCSNKLLAIDENGHCSQLWRRGMQKPLENKVDDIFKNKIVIEED